MYVARLMKFFLVYITDITSTVLASERFQLDDGTVKCAPFAIRARLHNHRLKIEWLNGIMR